MLRLGYFIIASGVLVASKYPSCTFWCKYTPWFVVYPVVSFDLRCQSGLCLIIILCYIDMTLNHHYDTVYVVVNSQSKNFSSKSIHHVTHYKTLKFSLISLSEYYLSKRDRKDRQ